MIYLEKIKSSKTEKKAGTDFLLNKYFPRVRAQEMKPYLIGKYRILPEDIIKYWKSPIKNEERTYTAYFSVRDKKSPDITSANVIKRKGGIAFYFSPRPMANINRIPARMRRIGRLLSQDGVLEILLFVGAESPVPLDKLQEFSINNVNPLDLVDQLDRCGLLRLVENKILLTEQSKELLNNFQAEN